MITLENINFRYSSKGPLALQGISAEIGPGIHLLMGENGAGKTTLLHLIAGLLKPTEGKCLIDGAKSYDLLPSILSGLFLCGVNIDFPMRSIADMVKYHAPFYPNFSAEMLTRNLSNFGIEATTLLSDLSTGNAQKAKLAYALALRTPILLLDEPINGVDIDSKKQLQRMIAESISEEQTVIISTHAVSDLENFYDGVIDLHQGRLMYALSIDQILDRLCFGSGPSVPESAIYSEPWIGQFRYIQPNTDGRLTDIDYELLYMAARSNRLPL